MKINQSREFKYFSRRLRMTDHDGSISIISDAELFVLDGPKVILGEPGMGKTELMLEASRVMGSEAISAVRFMYSKKPEKFITQERPLLIDGLDEAMTKKDGDAVDEVLSQLEALDLPDFLLTCRSREWQARSEKNLNRLYRKRIRVVTLEPLNRAEAAEFLSMRVANVDSESVLSHLERHGIQDLYANPLMLDLLGRIAEVSQTLPGSRAGLLEQVCQLLWPEHDTEREESNLTRLVEEDALMSAGAIMASLLLAGANAVTKTSLHTAEVGEISLQDIERLPGAAKAGIMFSSKLFVSNGVDRARPIHRVIAEFLGARYLARCATSPRQWRRLLASLQQLGTVPASLRGLHAWLAYHGGPIAKGIIRTDPFGVLRYGETSMLTPSQALELFDALKNLSVDDPYFRSDDWNVHSASGLLITELQLPIREVIGSPTSNFHLRSLILEGLKGTPVALQLSDILEAILLSPDRFYRERRAAGEALISLKNNTWARSLVQKLRDQGIEDSTRLAIDWLVQIKCDVDNDLLVATLLADLGLTISPLPREFGRKPLRIREYERILYHLNNERIVSVLDLFVESICQLQNIDPMSMRDIAKISSKLIIRAIEMEFVGVMDATKIWAWLGLVSKAEYFREDETKELQKCLDENDEIRRAVQCHGLSLRGNRYTVWIAETNLDRRLVGLSRRPNDVAWFLMAMRHDDNRDPDLRQAWCDFMRLGVGPAGFLPEVRDASRFFQRGDPQLEAVAKRLANPKKSQWAIRQEKQARKKDRKKLIAKELRRRDILSQREAVLTGELPIIAILAQWYLGVCEYYYANLSPEEGLAYWIGEDLAADAATGFNNVLSRNDLPSPGDIATGFSENMTWNYGYAIIAGLTVRHRAGNDLSNLPSSVLRTGLLLAYDKRCSGCRDDDSSLIDALESLVLTTSEAQDAFFSTWVEPALIRKVESPRALYMLARDNRLRDVAVRLVPDWLLTFRELPLSLEIELINCLSNIDASEALATVARSRANRRYACAEQTLTWFAVEFCAIFDEIRCDIQGVDWRYPSLIWYIRDRMQAQKHGSSAFRSVSQAAWIIKQFRLVWPYSKLVGSSSGIENSHDATDFIISAISWIADDTSDEAVEAMQLLRNAPNDSYTDLIRHMAVEQRQKIAEVGYSPLEPRQLRDLLSDGPPTTIDDLKAMVIEVLSMAQRILDGDDLDQVRDFWNDSGLPRDENRCRDRLAAMISPELMRYGIQRITEADMPLTKRADLAFSTGSMQLPMEVKGQWHEDVWNAATDQLAAQYLIDWRSEQRGIYCVLWFGNLPSNSNRRLKAPPTGYTYPNSPEEMQHLLEAALPSSRRHQIDVVVLDFSSGK